MADRADTLKKLHTRVYDSIEGYREAKEKIDGSEHEPFLVAQILEREGFLTAIGEKLRAENIEAKEDGSTLAAAHRSLFGIREALSSGSSGVLKECVRGDKELKSTYDDAIEATDGEGDWTFLRDQRKRVEHAIEEIGGRD